LVVSKDEFERDSEDKTTLYYKIKRQGKKFMPLDKECF
jgi:hypothetical protein